MAKKQKQPKKPISNTIRLVVFWVLMVAVVVAVFGFGSQKDDLKEVTLSSVTSRANSGEIKKIEIQGNEIKVTPNNQDEPTEKSVKDGSSSIYEQGLNKDSKAEVEVVPPSETGSALWTLASIFIPVLLIGALFIFMMRQAQGQNNQAMGFGKSKAKLYGLDKEKVVFGDIAGNDSAKQDLEEVVDFLKAPKKYEELGAKIPKGVLLVGNPGTGKTMLARAVAGEANVPFFSISGSEFVEMFVGVGASRVRDLFAKAKKNSPAIIFIDEIDAVHVHRVRRPFQSHAYDQQHQFHR